MLVTVLLGEEPSNPAVRDYASGPLTAADFAAPVPEDAGQIQAFTTTDLRYSLEYRVTRRKQRSTAELTSFSIHAVVVPSASWNRRPDDRRLLDHEQGHFDLTYIAGLRARVAFEEEDKPRGTGVTEDLAIADLRKKVTEAVSAWIAGLKSEHERYDRVTRHGQDQQAQAAERQRHREEMKSLRDPEQPNDSKNCR
jgi:hypothetical protein